jgi:hypothetical protein
MSGTTDELTDRRIRGRQLTQYLLGVRLAFTGGRNARVRVLLSALAVGLGVAVLLLVAAIPAMNQHRNARLYSQYDTFYGSSTAAPTDHSVLIGDASTVFKGQSIRGRVVQPDGPGAPLPPGVARYPAPGQMAVSPALRTLLSRPGSELLRERLPYRISGSIGQAGLIGPGQLSFVLGSDRLSLGAGAVRIDQYGHYYPGEPLSPVLLLLCVVGFVVMLVPVAVFLGAAARFGGEQRDRRLAALRLCGADRRMTARIAAGESLAGAVLGLCAGVLVFLLGRQLGQSVTVQGVSFFARDVTPQPVLAALVVLLVPLLAVGATLLAMRGVTVDPLGVVRRASVRGRRLWWRLLVPAAGLAVLLWAVRDPAGLQQTRGAVSAAVGTVLLLAGVAALLPWLVAEVTRRAGGGLLSWQLAVRRLRFGGSSAGAVGGIVVAVAGAIALQTLFTGVSATYSEPPVPGAAGAPTSGYRAQVDLPGGGSSVAGQAASFRASPDVRAALGFTEVTVMGGAGAITELVVADCTTLRAFAALPRCADGDFFVARSGPDDDTAGFSTGERVSFSLDGSDGSSGSSLPWRLPAPTATVPARANPLQDAGDPPEGEFLATPGAVPAALLSDQDSSVYVDYDQSAPDALDQVRTTAARISPMAAVTVPGDPTVDHNFSLVSRALLIGAGLTLLLIAASLLVGLLEQLRERRKVLAVLHAVGAARRLVALSVLWQSVLPVALGLALAVVGGLALGGVLLHLAQLPLAFDWGAIGLMTGLGALSVLLVTALSLPPLLRMMRPVGLRHE